MANCPAIRPFGTVPAFLFFLRYSAGETHRLWYGDSESHLQKGGHESDADLRKTSCVDFHNNLSAGPREAIVPGGGCHGWKQLAMGFIALHMVVS